MSKRSRDHQVSKVYAAENAVFPMHNPVEKYRKLDDCNEFLKKIIATQYWHRHKGWKRINIGDGRGRSSACYKPWKKQVCLPLWARNEHVMIHEMAHCLTHRTQNDPNGGVGHGTHFAGHYLNLIDELMGMDEAMKLMESFDEKGVIYHLQ